MVGLLKKTIVKLQTRMKGNLKHTSDNSSSLSGPQNKDIGAALQILLTKLINYVFTEGRLHIKMPSIRFMCRKVFFICISFVNNKLIIFLVVFYLFHRIA